MITLFFSTAKRAIITVTLPGRRKEDPWFSSHKYTITHVTRITQTAHARKKDTHSSGQGTDVT